MGSSRVFRYNKNVERWISEIREAKKVLGIDDYKYPDALILAMIHVESSGLADAHRDNSQFYGLLQQGTDNAREIKLPNGKVNDKNGYRAILNFLRWMELPSKRKNHQYIPEYIALIWKGGGGTLREYKRTKSRLGKDAARQFLASKWKGSPLIYLRYFQSALELWVSRTGETNIAALDDDFDQGTIPTRARTDTLWGGDGSIRAMTPFELGSYATPEELRKGIIAQFYYINEWHLTQLASPEAADIRAEQEDGANQSTVEQTSTESLKEDEVLESSLDNPPRNDSSITRGDNMVDERRRYAQALVEAEFYRRRFANRSVPVVTGPFNPYPVAGFPGLLMTPGRPIMGYITNVSHTISVAGGSGSTAVTMSSPRYWDEGEVWYWAGGTSDSDPVMRNFPQWHNREVVPSNNVSPGTFDRPTNEKGEPFFSKLDRFYKFMLGVPSIEYYSNSSGIANPENITIAIRDRDPGPLEVKEETLDIKEYNTVIASLDSKGRFAPGTLAHRFYGPIKPYDTSEANATVDSQINYVERYGVSERELLEDFLGNSFSRVEGSGKLVVTGPTFGGDQINAIQNQMIEYMKDLERRNLQGGV